MSRGKSVSKPARAALAAVVAAVSAVSFGAEATVDHYVEYLESTGKEWILTDYTPTSNTVVEVDLALTKLYSWRCVFCSRGNGSSDRTYSLYYTDGSNGRNGWRWDYNTVWGTYGGQEPAVNVRRSFVCAPYGLFRDGTKVTPRVRESFVPANVITIFTAYTTAPGSTPTDAQTTDKALMRLYRFVARDGDAIKLDLAPCVDSDGKPALYDRVGKRFLYNQGTGTFTVGPNASEPRKPYYNVCSGGTDGVDLDAVGSAYDKGGALTLAKSSSVEVCITGKVDGVSLASGASFEYAGYGDRLLLWDSGLVVDKAFAFPIRLSGYGNLEIFDSVELGSDWQSHFPTWDAGSALKLRLAGLTVKDTSGTPFTFKPEGNLRIGCLGGAESRLGQDGSRLTADFSNDYGACVGAGQSWTATYRDNRLTKTYVGGASARGNAPGYAHVIVKTADYSSEAGEFYFSKYATAGATQQESGLTNTLTLAGGLICIPHLYCYGPETALIRFAGKDAAIYQPGDYSEMLKDDSEMKWGEAKGKFVLEGVDGFPIGLHVAANCYVGSGAAVELRGDCGARFRVYAKYAAKNLSTIYANKLNWDNLKGDICFYSDADGKCGRIVGQLPYGEGKGDVAVEGKAVIYVEEDQFFNSLTGGGFMCATNREVTFTVGCDGKDCTYGIQPANYAENLKWRLVKTGAGALTLETVPPNGLVVESGDLILGSTLDLAENTVKLASGSKLHVADGAVYAYPVTSFLTVDTDPPDVVIERGGVLVVGGDSGEVTVDLARFSGDATAVIRKVGANSVILTNYDKFKGAIELQGGSIVPSLPPANLTWNGGAGADTSFDNYRNWQGLAGETFLRGFTATFATGGSKATFVQDTPLSGIVFDQKAEGETGFALDGTGTVTVGEGGITARLPSEGTNTYTIAAPLAVGASQPWTVPDTIGKKQAADLVVSGPIASVADGLKVTGSGWGNVYLSAVNSTSTAELSFSITGRVHVAGDNAWGAAGSKLSIAKGGDVRFCGGTYSGDFYSTLGTSPATVLFASAKGSTNVFNGTVTLNEAHRFSIGANSLMEFNKPFYCKNWSYLYGSDRKTSILRFNDTCTLVGGQSGTITLDFRAPDNAFGTGDEMSSKYGNSLFLLNCEWAWNTSRNCRLWNGATIDLCGHNNKVGTLQLMNGTVTNSGAKATLWTEVNKAELIEQDPYTDKATQTRITPPPVPVYLRGDFTGPATLGKMGPYDLTVTNRAISSSGDVIVAAGTLRFSANSSWKNAAEVIVTNATAASAAVLEINQRGTFGKNTVVRLGNGGKIRIGGAETAGKPFTQRVKALYVDGVRQLAGSYSSDGHDGTTKCDLIEGPGILHTSGRFMLIVK